MQSNTENVTAVNQYVNYGNIGAQGPNINLRIHTAKKRRHSKLNIKKYLQIKHYLNCSISYIDGEEEDHSGGDDSPEGDDDYIGVSSSQPGSPSTTYDEHKTIKFALTFHEIVKPEYKLPIHSFDLDSSIDERLLV